MTDNRSQGSKPDRSESAERTALRRENLSTQSDRITFAYTVPAVGTKSSNLKSPCGRINGWHTTISKCLTTGTGPNWKN